MCGDGTEQEALFLAFVFQTPFSISVLSALGLSTFLFLLLLFTNTTASNLLPTQVLSRPSSPWPRFSRRWTRSRRPRRKWPSGWSKSLATLSARSLSSRASCPNPLRRRRRLLYLALPLPLLVVQSKLQELTVLKSSKHRRARLLLLRVPAAAAATRAAGKAAAVGMRLKKWPTRTFKRFTPRSSRSRRYFCYLRSLL